MTFVKKGKLNCFIKFKCDKCDNATLERAQKKINVQKAVEGGAVDAQEFDCVEFVSARPVQRCLQAL